MSMDDDSNLLESLLEQTSPMDAPPSTIDPPPSSSPTMLFSPFERAFARPAMHGDPNILKVEDQAMQLDPFAFLMRTSSPIMGPSPNLPTSQKGQVLFSMGPFPMIEGMYTPKNVSSSQTIQEMNFGAYQLQLNDTFSQRPLFSASSQNNSQHEAYTITSPLIVSNRSDPFASCARSQFQASLHGANQSKVNWEGIQSYLAGIVRPGPDVPYIYKCDKCHIEFPNAQAYGGHMSSHSKAMKSKKAMLSTLSKKNCKPSTSSKESKKRMTKKDLKAKADSKGKSIQEDKKTIKRREI
ncbi:hypothetical protein J5N97_016830 [Dioscorea zingiberensis]|uniref:C2H2-type domain-containing protein n=1 Tax=Dioscorea zingiberensis TaxID=325984 RepID=A0A9D5HFS7_9LILI|nr:hypothetical protein J5N97_016830 [Dioscorea zingiberensis]